MSTTNVYFSHGTRNEQYLVEDLIIESLKIYGQEFFYIPRTLVSKDNILGEDRLSQFKSSFPIEMYFENVDSLDGQGAFIQKFGLMMEQSATLVVARRRWEQLVGRYGQTTIPTRPNEGDLIYFPLTKGLFEIKFVKHQDPFYQLGKLYVYKLQVELFQYASERIDTGISAIDTFESLKTFSTNTTRSPYGEVVSINVTNQGSGYTSIPTVSFESSNGIGAAATAVLGSGTSAGKVIRIDVTNGGTNYTTAPVVSITGGGGTGALASASIKVDIDKVESFGDNNSFKDEAADILFNENNPFGEIE
jgi:Virus neck protein